MSDSRRASTARTAAQRRPAELGGTLRTLVLHVPDFTAVAHAEVADIPPSTPAVVLHAGRVISADAQARAAGIAVGLGRRAVGHRCPQAAVLDYSEDIEQRLFARSVGILEDHMARFTLLRPGTVGVPVSSFSHTHTEDAAAEELLTVLTDATGWEVLAGIADSPFAAVLAAHRSHRVEAGRTAEFLAPLPVSTLAEAHPERYADFAQQLNRLGLRTLGDLAALSADSVYTRFGSVGRRARLLAAGLTESLPTTHLRAVDVTVSCPIEPPTGRSDALSFYARSAAAELFRRVRSTGLVCTQVTVVLHSRGTEPEQRTWRLPDMDESHIADRVRWQADGWMATRGNTPVSASQAPDAGSPEPDSDGVSLIELTAAELVRPLESTADLFSSRSGDVSRTLERLQGLFGPDAVRVPHVQGGREPSETNLWTPWQQSPRPLRDSQAPWPGALPAPRPTLVETADIDLFDTRGNTVVARPSGLDSPPDRIVWSGGEHSRVIAYSSAWPVEAEWWDPPGQYRVRLQVLTDDDRAFLLKKEDGQWSIAGRYE